MASMGANAGAASTAKAPIPSATIEVTATYIQFERATVGNEKKFREEGRLSHKHILEMWRADKGSLLTVMSVTTLDSVAATARSGREIICPTEHAAQAFSLLGEDREAFTITVMIPENFETRETGNFFSVTPHFDRKEDVVTLSLHAAVTEFIEWLDFDLTKSNRHPCSTHPGRDSQTSFQYS